MEKIQARTTINQKGSQASDQAKILDVKIDAIAKEHLGAIMKNFAKALREPPDRKITTPKDDFPAMAKNYFDKDSGSAIYSCNWLVNAHRKGVGTLSDVFEAYSLQYDELTKDESKKQTDLRLLGFIEMHEWADLSIFFKPDYLTSTPTDKEFRRMRKMRSILPWHVPYPYRLLRDSDRKLLGYTSEWIDGLSIGEYFCSRALPPKGVEDQIIHIAKALDREDFVHGDLHANNFIVRKLDDRVFLIDNLPDSPPAYRKRLEIKQQNEDVYDIIKDIYTHRLWMANEPNYALSNTTHVMPHEDNPKGWMDYAKLKSIDCWKETAK